MIVLSLLVTGLAAVTRINYLKNKAEVVERENDTLKARHHVVKGQAKIKRKEEKELISRKADIVKELKKSKEEFKGIDSLTDSNDF